MTLRVLVVDRDARVRTALRLLLDSTVDLRVVAEAATADAAYELCTAAAPDVAVVDVQLPDVACGAALIRALSPQLPVVSLSVSRAGRAAAIEAGALQFVDKDGRTDALLTAVREAAATRSRPADRLLAGDQAPLR